MREVVRTVTFVGRKFNVDMKREIHVGAMGWPSEEEAGNERILGGNLGYCDLRGFSWEEASATGNKEEELIERILQAEDPETELELIDDELYEDDIGLYGLDIGVASAVVGLSAAGCVPCCSCNGGAFGGFHKEDYPLIAFFAPTQMTDLLLECAGTAGLGLENSEHGTLLAYANDIEKIRAFGQLLIEKRCLFECQGGTRGD